MKIIQKKSAMIFLRILPISAGAFSPSIPITAPQITGMIDIELIAVLSGEMEYSVNGELLKLKKGQGLLVNAGQMHFGFSHQKKECDFICVLLHPVLLCPLPSYERDFVNPVIHNKGLPYFLLKPDIPWEKDIYDKILYLYDIRKEKTAPLKILAAFARIWELLCENISADKNPAEKKIQEKP